MRESDSNHSRHLLVAGTEKVLQLFLSITLEEAGFHVTIAKDGMEALYIIKTFNFTKDPFDLLVFDKNLQKISLENLIRNLEELKIFAPIIIIHSSKTEKGKKDFCSDRVVKYIQTPFSKEEFLTAITQILTA